MKHLLVYLVIVSSPLVLFSQDKETATPQWRPIYHFTPVKNWTNDPNGLIYMNGVYHLYNQQNPFENKWGHMSWGHATSKDLMHWQHLPVAIPETIDKDTTWRFSGCVVWDKNNTSGFCKTGGCLVAVYTADQPDLKKESQFIAYSNDGGMTYTNYDKNPVIDLNKKDFRDPNVTWNEQLQQWLMVVSVPAEYKIRFYASKNLKDWNLLSEFGPAGLTQSAWECPSFMKLKVNGNPVQEKWVLMVSSWGHGGPFMQYFTGDFDGTNFKSDNPAQTVLTVDYGDCFYAAIPWNNLPADKKTFIGWMVPGDQPTSPWTGQMSVARDLGLTQTADGLRLVQQPAAVIKNNLAKISGNQVLQMKNLQVNNEEKDLDAGHRVTGNAYWLMANWNATAGTISGIKIAQAKDGHHKTVHEVVIGYDADKHELFVDRTNGGYAKINGGKLKQTVKIDNNSAVVNIEILVDKSSLEIFFNNGEKVITDHIYPASDGASSIAAFSTGGITSIKSVQIWNLSKLH